MNNTAGDYDDFTGDFNWKWNTGYYYNPKEGWICPKCGRVFSPWVKECPYCGGNSQITVIWRDDFPTTYYLGDDDLGYDIIS
jgi:hypothetical protein